MPHTVRVRASLARHLLTSPDTDLRRRVAVLRAVPFPPGSRSLASDAEWHALAGEFAGLRAFVYGSLERAPVYTYDADSQTLGIEFAVVNGAIVARAAPT